MKKCVQFYNCISYLIDEKSLRSQGLYYNMYLQVTRTNFGLKFCNF